MSGFRGIEILVGRGIGFGTNSAANLLIIDGHPLSDMMSSADSMVTVLAAQLGIAGVILFYSILAWAYLRDPEARPLYLVFAITSLTINVTEFFPVNFLLGLALARSFSLSSRARALSCDHQSSGAGDAAPWQADALVDLDVGRQGVYRTT
jgi:hypothetical protein